MQAKESSSPDFVRRRLPWLIGIAALALYLVTLNRWLRLESLAYVGKVAGWDWTPFLQAPLQFLVGLAFSWLPGSVLPLALNVLAATLAALSLATLARCVALLPFDRTRETRLRVRSEDGLLHIPWAWLPQVLAVLVCGLQLTFWEHATAATGEMLDLLLFACLVRCLLEFRLRREEKWLVRFAVLYGVATANNYAMVAFFPAFLVAFVWIKGLEVFNARFILKVIACGCAGLVVYLVLPLAGAFRSDYPTFWDGLKNLFLVQRQALLGFPRYVILLLALQCVVPILILGIRTRSNQGETSTAGLTVNALIVRGIHLLMFVLCLSACLDLAWGPRILAQGSPMLPMFFLAALGAGYYCGYLLLISQRPPGRGWARESGLMRGIGQLGALLVLVAGVATPAWLLYQNLPRIRRNDGVALRDMSDLMAQCLPREGAYLLSDNPSELLLTEAALSRVQPDHTHLLVTTRLLPFRMYHEHMARQHPGRWNTVLATGDAGVSEPIDSAVLTRFVADLAATNAVFYLHPSMGYFFEAVAMEPHGLVYRLRPLAAPVQPRAAFDEKVLDFNREFWNGAERVLSRLSRVPRNEDAGIAYVASTYSRGLNLWGVALQRQGLVKEASRFFERAAELNPANDQARVNLACNRELVQGKPLEADLSAPLELKEQVGTWEELLLRNGPFDSPRYTFEVGLVYARGGLYWQALTEFRRVTELLPNEAKAKAALWRDDMEAMTCFARGDAKKAEQLARVLASQERYAREDLPLETLSQIYMRTGRFPEARDIIKQQLALNPANQAALLNAGLVAIRLQDYAGAVTYMDQLLRLVPNFSGALLNRAIAHLQSGNLDAAEADYAALRKLIPQNWAVYFGLGEIASRRKNAGAALEAFGHYLELAPKGTAEYTSVAQRVAALKAGKQD